jgi:hypothetical protein
VRIDGFGRMARVVRGASFDLNEYNRSSIDRNNIQFTSENAVAAMEDLVALPLEKLDGGALATAAERLLAK